MHVRRWLALACLGVVLGAAACDEPGPTTAPQDDPCAPVVWIRPTRANSRLAIVGSWDDWRGTGIPLQRAGDSGYAGARVPAGAGEFGYLVLEDGVPRLDADNPLTTFRGDNEVSLLEVPACGAAALGVTKIETNDAGDVTIEARLSDARTGKPRDLASASASHRDPSVATPMVATAGAVLTLRAEGLPRGRHSFTLSASDREGNVVTQRASAWVAPRARRWEDALVYQIMIDRFRGDEGAYLSPPKTPGDRAGGTLSGVEAALADGSLDALGVSALWLSPVYQNPVAPQTDRFGNVVTGYHGYWPIDDAAIEPRFGGEAALRRVVDLAHAKGIRVLLDVVPNHVFDTHPVYVEHRTDGWFHQSSACVCGSALCPWSTHIEDCWFTPYLPDFRFENPLVSARASEEVTRWIVDWDLDGVRIDAVPMMKRSVTRRINRDVRRAVGERNEALLLGEIFTGPGAEGIEAIRPFLGPAALDSAFDFPGMWALRAGFGSGGSLTEIESLLATEDTRYAGSGTLSARIIGNHDVSRFLSDAVGNGSNDPWKNPPAQPDGPKPYQAQRLALAFLLTMPGMPVLYYGDELALAGAGDPDCRRPQPPPAALSDQQTQTLGLARKLGSLRACSAALRDPTRTALISDPALLVYERRSATSEGPGWIVAFPTADAVVTLPAAVQGTYRDVLGGGTVTFPGSLAVTAGEPRVLAPVGDPCLAPVGVELTSGAPMDASAATASPIAAPEPLATRLRALRDALGEGLVEREIPLRLALLAALAGEHLLLLGPPGTAKSLLARRLRLAFHGASLFERLLTRFSVPEELFGPLSLRALEDDRYERATAGFLPTAHVAFLDEVFKANSAILNALLTLLNEREFDNGHVRQKTPLVAVIAASNELPEGEELAALYDRFLLRCFVGPVSDQAFDRLLDLAPVETPAIAPALQWSGEALSSLRREAGAVTLGAEARALLHDARRFHRERGIPVSDRRFRKIVGLLQMSAHTNGRAEISIWDCALLLHVTWDTPDHEAEVRAFYASRIGLGGREGEELPRLLAALEARVEEDRTSRTQARDAEGRLLYGGGDETPGEPPQPSPIGKRQKRSANDEPLFLRPAAWGLDRTNGGQGYTEGELDFDHRSRSFRAWEERASYLADRASFFVEERSLAPTLEPTRFPRAYVDAAVRDAEELRAALARHRDGLARTLAAVPRDVVGHLWIDPAIEAIAVARLGERVRRTDEALQRCQALVEAAGQLPLRSP